MLGSNPTYKPKISRKNRLTSGWALRKWISAVSLLARTDWVVIVDHTDCIDSTSSRARILASAPDASLADRTITAENTLRPAADIGIAYIIFLTGASNLAIDDCTLSIRSARIWIARILWFWRWNIAICLTQEEWITSVAWRAVTDRIVVFHVTVSIDTTRTWTWVLTTLANTS